jgi:hypothetical protein
MCKLEEGTELDVEKGRRFNSFIYMPKRLSFASYLSVCRGQAGIPVTQG